ncbi:MAG: hypothetical protein KGI38_00575 [Thaumarchaeota archaeon]|nr:hypothetical protein [Nitrososphaerota archaeon]
MQYAEGQWFSSIALCGAIVEFIGKGLIQVSIENSKQARSSDRISKILRLLKEDHTTSDKEFPLLDGVRDLRDKHHHLRMPSQGREELKTANLNILNNLLEYLMVGPSWRRIMT